VKKELKIDPRALPCLLDYNIFTGKLYWLRRPLSMFETARAYKTWNTTWAGQEALASISVAGYPEGTLLKTRVYAHRVCVAHYYGTWPEDEVDHINGVPTDNRIMNLRPCSRKENVRNSHKRSFFTSKFLGVCWAKNVNKWHAQITVDRVNINLGYYEIETDAASAYDAAAQQYFGSFANCNFLAPENVAHERMGQIVEIMRRVPDWAPGLPLDAEATVTERMEK